MLIRDINERLNSMPTAVPIDGVVTQLKNTMARIEVQNEFINLYINFGLVGFLIYGNVLYFGYHEEVDKFCKKTSGMYN